MKTSKMQHIFKFKCTLFLITIVLLFSCSSNELTQVPSNILSKEKMAAVLTDSHILEAAMNLNISNEVQAVNENRGDMMLAILKKNEVTKEQYDESFQFYSEHPVLLGDIYKLVLNNLSELQAKTANEKEPAKDSLKKDSVKVPFQKP